MKRFLITLLVLGLIAQCNIYSSCGGIKDPVRPDKQPPGDPPDGPPKPPPPPPQNGRALASSSDESYLNQQEQIALRILHGQFGPELQRMLADEISSCINQMSTEKVVRAFLKAGSVRIRATKGTNNQVLFDSSYLITDLLDGDYGDAPRLALHDYMRSSDDLLGKK